MKKETHPHKYNDKAVKALEDSAKELEMSYSAVKYKFVTENDLKVTELFWRHFFKNNPNINPGMVRGIDYCRGCQKFMVYYP